MLKKKKIPFLAFFRETRRKRRRLYFLSRQNCAEVILFLNRKKTAKESRERSPFAVHTIPLHHSVPKNDRQ